MPVCQRHQGARERATRSLPSQRGMRRKLVICFVAALIASLGCDVTPDRRSIVGLSSTRGTTTTRGRSIPRCRRTCPPVALSAMSSMDSRAFRRQRRSNPDSPSGGKLHRTAGRTRFTSDATSTFTTSAPSQRPTLSRAGSGHSIRPPRAQRASFFTRSRARETSILRKRRRLAASPCATIARSSSRSRSPSRRS